MILLEVWDSIGQFKQDESIFIELPITAQSKCHIGDLIVCNNVAELLIADIEDIKHNLELQIKDYSRDLICDAVKYYLDNDAFIEIV